MKNAETISTLHFCEMKSGRIASRVFPGHRHRFSAFFKQGSKYVEICIHCEATRAEAEQGYKFGKWATT